MPRLLFCPSPWTMKQPMLSLTSSWFLADPNKVSIFLSIVSPITDPDQSETISRDIRRARGTVSNVPRIFIPSAYTHTLARSLSVVSTPYSSRGIDLQRSPPSAILPPHLLLPVTDPWQEDDHTSTEFAGFVGHSYPTSPSPSQEVRPHARGRYVLWAIRCMLRP